MSKAELLDALDAQLPYREWDKERQRSSILHRCKTIGFPSLRKAGLIADDPTKKVKNEQVTALIAQKGADLVNGGMSITKAAIECEIATGSLIYYCKRANIKLTPAFKRRSWDYREVTKQVIELVNTDGYRLAEVARKLDCNNALIVNALKSEGYKYNARKVQIEKL